jgi:AbrB family looped-hinge helix DNA binding protein
MVMVLSYGMKDVLNVMVPIDKAGRVVLPKDVRLELDIRPGDILRVGIHGLAVTLTPNKEKTGFVRQGKALVFSTAGDADLTTGMVQSLIEGERDENDRHAVGGLVRTRSKP